MAYQPGQPLPYLDDEGNPLPLPPDPAAAQGVQPTNAPAPKPPAQQSVTIPFSYGTPGQGQQRQAPPAPSDAVSALGPPPVYKPSKVGGILSMLAGGAAGFLNTSAGKPGHIARPIDPTAAENALSGRTDFADQMANYTNRMKIAEYQDTQKEKEREADIRYQQAMANQDYTKAYRDQVTATRQQREDERTRQDQQNTMNFLERQGAQWVPETALSEGQTHAAALPTNPDNPGPIPTDSLNNEFGDFPAGQQATPGQQSGPASAIPTVEPWRDPTKFNRFPVGPNSLPPEANGFAPMLPTAAYKAQLAHPPQKDPQAGWAALPPSVATQLELEDPAEKFSPSSYNAMMKLAHTPDKAPKGAPQTADDLLAQRTADVITGFPEYDRITPAQAKAAMQAKHPANNINNQVPLPGSDTAPSATAKMMAQYDLAPPPYPANTRNPTALANYDALMKQIQAVNSNYKPDNFPLVHAYRNPAKNAVGGNINSLNTVSRHANDMVNDMVALNNNDPKAINRIATWIGGELNNATVTNAQTARLAVATEIAAALKGGQPDVASTQQWLQQLNIANSPEQIQGLKQTIASALGRRYEELQNQYYGNIGEPWKNIISGPAEQFLKSAGYDTSAIRNPGAPPQAAPTSPGGGGLDAMRKKYNY